MNRDRHIRREHEKRTFLCKICGKGFGTKSSANRHEEDQHQNN